MDYYVMLKSFGGWSSIDRVDKPLTKEEYLKILEEADEKALIREVEEADDFKTEAI